MCRLLKCLHQGKESKETEEMSQTVSPLVPNRHINTHTHTNANLFETSQNFAKVNETVRYIEG